MYWLTYVSNALAESLSIGVSDVSNETEQFDELDGGVLMRFYDKPENWQSNAERLDELCAVTNGIFSIRKVNESVTSDMNFIELNDALEKWE